MLPASLILELRARACALALALALFSAVLPAQQRSDGRVLVDEDYCFRLAVPPAWKILAEDDIRVLVPDAVAGAFWDDGVYAAIIPEAIFGVELEDYARLLLDNLGLEEKTTKVFEREEFQGRPAVRFEVTGLGAGVRFRFRNVVFFEDGFAVQIITWGAQGVVHTADLESFDVCFSLLDGEMRERDRAAATADTHGVGWRVENGVFVSAALGIEVAPQGRWRLAVGVELDSMNTDAEVGLIHANPDCYVTIVAEHAFGTDHERFRRMVLDREILGSRRSGRTRVLCVAGHEVEFEEWESDGQIPMRFLRGAFFHDELCVQMLAWHWSGVAETADELLPQAMDGIRFLSPSEVEGIARVLTALPDAENRVGPNFALRRGVYRDFEYGITWTKPVGFWRVLVGQGARAVHEDATFVLEEPSLSLHVLAIAETDLGFTPEEYHRLVVESLFGEARPPDATEELELGEATGLLTEMHHADGELEWIYAITTVVHRGTALQFIVYSLPGNMRAGSDAVRACIEGLDFPPTLSASRTIGTRHVDQRMGYRLTLPPGTWKHFDPTPTAIRPIASFDEWRSPHGTNVLVFALCALEEGQDQEWIGGFFQGILRDKLGAERRGEPSVGEAHVAGQICRRESWNLGRGTLRVYHLARDNTFYGLVIETPDGGEAAADAVVRGFELID